MTDLPTPTPPLKGRGLSPQDEARRLNTPPLQGRGRGWGLSAERLSTLEDRARHMRREPTEPEKRLWRRLSLSQLGYKFRRQAVIGGRVADFVCPAKTLIVEVDGDTHSAEIDAARDAELAALGYRVLHVTNADVMREMDAVLALILSVLESAPDRWSRPPHPNPSPEGEGLS